jgi:hypothetical protein
MRVKAFLPQLRALFHPEPVLLIHYHKAQFRKSDLFLYQGMSSYDKIDFTVRQLFFEFLFGFALNLG